MQKEADAQGTCAYPENNKLAGNFYIRKLAEYINNLNLKQINSTIATINKKIIPYYKFTKNKNW